MVDKDLWTFIRLAHELELKCFGRKYRGLKPLRYKTTRDIGDVQHHVVWSVSIV